ncbi:hypothetical protein ACP70R_021584 [Stipagrostis hirtigluma subsp. patula]
MALAYGSVRWWRIFTPDQCSGINRFVMGIPLLQGMYGAGGDAAPDAGALMVHFVVLQSVVWYTLMLFLFEDRAARLLVMEQFPDRTPPPTSSPSASSRSPPAKPRRRCTSRRTAGCGSPCASPRATAPRRRAPTRSPCSSRRSPTSPAWRSTRCSRCGAPRRGAPASTKPSSSTSPAAAPR